MKRFVTTALVGLLTSSALADPPVGNNFTTPQKSATIAYLLTSTLTVNTWKTMYVGGSITTTGPTVPLTGNAGFQCKSLTATNDDSSPHNIIWQIIDNNGNEVDKHAVQVPAMAGMYGVQSAPLWGPGLTPNETLDEKGNEIFELYPGWSVQVALNDVSQIASGKFVGVRGTCYQW